MQSVQTISNQLYWSIGELILKKQQEFGWGKAVVEQLSRDLSRHIGEGVSWSPRNLWFMRQLADEYSSLKQPIAGAENLKQLVSEVPWGHNILILQKVKNIKARLSTRQIAETMQATGMKENKVAGKEGGGIAKKARIALESKTGKKVITEDNYLSPQKSLKKLDG